MSSNKRSRADGEEKRDKQEEANALLEQLLLLRDPAQLARAAKGNADRFAKLATFSKKLRKSIVAVKTELEEEERAAVEKDRKEMLASGKCFECKESKAILSACAGFRGGDGWCKGIMVCDDCVKKSVGSCVECNSFLCHDCDPSYNFNVCDEYLCLTCAEKDSTTVVIKTASAVIITAAPVQKVP